MTKQTKILKIKIYIFLLNISTNLHNHFIYRTKGFSDIYSIYRAEL